MTYLETVSAELRATQELAARYLVGPGQGEPAASAALVRFCRIWEDVHDAAFRAELRLCRPIESEDELKRLLGRHGRRLLINADDSRRHLERVFAQIDEREVS